MIDAREYTGFCSLQVNQIGSVTESINAVKLAKQNGWGVMTSHRSGTLLFAYCQLYLLFSAQDEPATSPSKRLFSARGFHPIGCH
jgi:hypothetical protein